MRMIEDDKCGHSSSVPQLKSAGRQRRTLYGRVFAMSGRTSPSFLVIPAK